MTNPEKEHKYTTPFQEQFIKVAIIGLGGCLLLAVLGKALDKYESKNSRIKQLTEQLDSNRDQFYDMANQRNSYLPNNITLKDVNQDGLQDLVYKSKMIYFQTKDGKFATLNEILEHEQEKANARADSIRNVILKTTIDEVKRKYTIK